MDRAIEVVGAWRGDPLTAITAKDKMALTIDTL
jgi:hypothetical protein